MSFYDLDKVGEGDKVVLKDRKGRIYEYRVSETFLADPTDSWVTGQVKGRDMVTLQTCTPNPAFQKRLIVRADRLQITVFAFTTLFRAIGECKVGAGRQKEVADPLTCTPLRKIRHQFQECKHTSLVFG